MIRSRKTILCIVLSLFILVFCSSVCFANGNGSNSVSVMINGQELQSDVNAFIDENGRTLVPFRVFMNQIGINNITYNTQTKEIIAKNDNDTEIKLIVGDYFAYVNGKRILLDTQSRIIMNRTMIPLRFVSEQFGMNVSYNNTNGVVSINSKKVSSSVGNVNSNNTNNSNINNVASTGHPKMPIYKGGQGLIGYHDPITGENSYIKSSNENNENNENTTQTTELPSNNSNGNTIIDTRPVEERMSAFINNNYYVLGVNDNNLIFKIGGSGHDLWNRFLPNEQQELVSRIYKNIKSQNLNKYKNFKDNDRVNVIINNDIDKQINEFQITW